MLLSPPLAHHIVFSEEACGLIFAVFFFFLFFREGEKGLIRLQTNQSMQQQVAWGTFKMSDTFVTRSASGPPAWTRGISPCCRCCWGCTCVSGGIDICPTRDASEHCSFLQHSKMCNSFEHRFCWARNDLASVIGTQVIRKALSILPNGSSLLKAAVCSVVLFSVFSCEPFSNRTQHWWSQQAHILVCL